MTDNQPKNTLVKGPQKPLPPKPPLPRFQNRVLTIPPNSLRHFAAKIVAAAENNSMASQPDSPPHISTISKRINALMAKRYHLDFPPFISDLDPQMIRQTMNNMTEKCFTLRTLLRQDLTSLGAGDLYTGIIQYCQLPETNLKASTLFNLVE